MSRTEIAWTTAKARYTALTNKKKPGAKFLGVFTKASGLEPLFKAFDKLPAEDFPNRRKTIDAIRVKTKAYLGVLEQAATADAASNKDTAVKQNLAAANKTLQADVDALLADVEAEYAKDLAVYKAQISRTEKAAADANTRKKDEGRGMINFGPAEVVVPQELVAAVKKAEAALSAFSSDPTPDNFNKVPHTSIMRLQDLLGKFGKAVDPEYRALAPFAKKVPATYSKAQMDNHLDQISIVIKRTKVKLKI